MVFKSVEVVDERTEAIDNLAKVCIKGKWYQQAVGVARLGASRRAIDSLVNFLWTPSSMTKAVEVAGMGASTEIISSLLKYCINLGDIDNTFKLSKLLGRNLLQEEIERLITCADIEKAVRLAPKSGLSPKIIDYLVKKSIEEGKPMAALKAAKLRGRKLSRKEVDLLVNVCRRSWPSEGIVAIAKFGASMKVINSLIETFIDEGAVIEAQEIAELRGKKLSVKEIDSLINLCIQKGFIERAQNTAEIRGKELSVKEIKKITEVLKK